MNIDRVTGRTWLSVAALFISVAFSAAAIADTGGLQVRVTDSSGNPIAGASVNASTSESLTRKSGVTDADGQIRLMGLDPSNDYVVTVTADGYQQARNEDVLVVSERTFSVPFALVGADEAMEEIITYGSSQVGQLVDTTSSLQSTDLTLDIMESLPTGRTYQSYLQMAPSTKPTPVENGNPSSKSGVNYQEIVDANGNTAGTSSDNVYYIDGVNITDNNTGTFGGNFNSEIIQEQQIITGGVPAEYEGGQGLISRVITKSGSNEFHGSLNYYTQSDSLVADNENLEDAKFSTFDTAFTLGGPIVKDKLWFFASYQRKERDEDVIDPNTQLKLRTVNRTEDLGFAKLTWQATENDKVVAEFFNDPFERSGSLNTATLNNRDAIREQGGDNYKFEYSHGWDNLILTASYMSHEGQVTNFAPDKSTRNDVAYNSSVPGVTNVDTLKGGLGSDTIDYRNKDSINLTLEWFIDTGMGSHAIKAGYSQTTNERNLNQIYTGDGAQYTSLGDDVGPLTYEEYRTGAWTGARRVVAADRQRIINAMAASPWASDYLALLDTDGSGALDLNEVYQLNFDSTAGNPTGDINVYRIVQSEKGATNYETEGDAFFLQDSWNIDEHWTINAGIRAEKWEHFATDGSSVFTFDYDIAPRLSVVYDVMGDGSSKVWGFYGRYYDPIRTNMTAFAGTVTGSVRDEQVYADGHWLTFRTRGGPGDPDGYFAPSTKTPYTDEFMVGYERALTADQSISITYTDRVTKDIMEDYDLGLYTDPAQCAELCLPLSYFGFSSLPTANYFIATLAGGKREYKGVEVSWRKRRSADSRWFGLASVTYNDAKGNTNSDSNADYQGDVFYLDPRAPNVYGPQPGNVEYLAKLAGSYRWDNGLEVGATYAWNSGTLYSITELAGTRHLPVQIDAADAYEFMGVTDQWLRDGVVGSQESPSYGTLNARAKYVVEFGNGYETEFFLDIFNVLDDQAANRSQDLEGGDGVYSFGQPNSWVLPRRFYLGARMSF
jgi:hypothetical protein